MKKILLTLFIVILALLLFWASKNINNRNNDNSTLSSTNEPPLPFGQITREERIKHIKWTYVNNKNYQQFPLKEGSAKEVVVTFYQPNPRDPDLSYENRRGGILVFQVVSSSPRLIWESKDNISLVNPAIDVRDINGDGNSDIISIWSDGKTDILYIYSWNGSDFKLITPMKKVEGLVNGSGNLYAPIFGVYRGDIQVKDLDGDKIDEVIISGGVTYDSMDNEVPLLGRKTIYKWNGTKYKLWKEEKVNK